MDAHDFDRVVVIGLRRRPKRLRHFWAGLPEPWPFAQVQHVVAIDGAVCSPPDWFAQSHPADRGRLVRRRVKGAPNLAGAWGCLRTHHRIWEDALNSGLTSVLVFEDDAVFCQGFVPRLNMFLDAVPDDWDQIYLGGQHLGARPVKINSHVLRSTSVNRTHAYAVRQPLLGELYRHFMQPWSSTRSQMFHVDHQLCQLHHDKARHIYCPLKWLVGQAEGVSDVKIGKPHREDWFDDFECVEDADTPELASIVSE